jgi:UDPglucose 6-dehydrogenase
MFNYKNMIIGIIGNGFVGKATCQLQCKDIKILAYDLNPDFCSPKGITLEDMNRCEIVFISVPTPMNTDNSCYLGIVKSVLTDLDRIGYKGFRVLRSTVPVGTSDILGCYFMPEFLTEKNYVKDFINNEKWIFGLRNANTSEDILFQHRITDLFTTAYNNRVIEYKDLNFVTNKEAEMIKMFRNCYLATKVSFCNEIAEFCTLSGVEYENVRVLAAADPRILPSHTAVPGPDGLRGFGGTCFPKDTASLNYEMEKLGMQSYVLKAAITRNEKVDRPEKDWCRDKGRAVVSDKTV